MVCRQIVMVKSKDAQTRNGKAWKEFRNKCGSDMIIHTISYPNKHFRAKRKKDFVTEGAGSFWVKS